MNQSVPVAYTGVLPDLFAEGQGMVGTGSIAGNAFFKGAVLAKKQYPPKGSQRVGLIHMSDEFKQWFETVKQSEKMPDQIPERIAKHFMFATILDDQGGFRFTRLPPGEYLLIADFSYKETVTRSEVTGARTCTPATGTSAPTTRSPTGSRMSGRTPPSPRPCTSGTARRCR